MLVAAINPCPCGYFGDPKRECRCSPPQIENYRQRIFDPLLDRIDLHIDVPLVDNREMSSTVKGDSSEVIQARVDAARDVQRERFQSEATKRDEKIQIAHTNAYLGPRMIGKYCALDNEGRSFLEHAMTQLNFSARTHDRILKVARTIADLVASETIRADDVLEVIQFRSLGPKAIFMRQLKVYLRLMNDIQIHCSRALVAHLNSESSLWLKREQPNEPTSYTVGWIS